MPLQVGNPAREKAELLKQIKKSLPEGWECPEHGEQRGVPMKRKGVFQEISQLDADRYSSDTEIRNQFCTSAATGSACAPAVTEGD